MSIKLILKAALSFILFTVSIQASSQQAENWTKDQLLEPARLAEIIRNKQTLPVIISIGPGALIPGSIAAGAAMEQENLDVFQQELKKLKSAEPVVIYCGCCPYQHCPNVRPAIDLLKKMKFTDFKLLDLPTNIKTDWIDKGYPTL